MKKIFEKKNPKPNFAYTPIDEIGHEQEIITPSPDIQRAAKGISSFKDGFSSERASFGQGSFFSLEPYGFDSGSSQESSLFAKK